MVDDCTESGVNLATQPSEKLRHDTIDCMVVMLRLFLAAGATPRMWKRDVSKAFRRLPVDASHLDLSWAAFVSEGVHMVAQHVAMSFGTTSAVHAWHRVWVPVCCRPPAVHGTVRTFCG